MRKLFVVLAWRDCILATWLFAGGQRQSGAAALASADQMLERSSSCRDSGFRWRPILAPHHGLTVSARG